MVTPQKGIPLSADISAFFNKKLPLTMIPAIKDLESYIKRDQTNVFTYDLTTLLSMYEYNPYDNPIRVMVTGVNIKGKSTITLNSSNFSDCKAYLLRRRGLQIKYRNIEGTDEKMKNYLDSLHSEFKKYILKYCSDVTDINIEPRF